jgi:hypothetical protein
LNNNINNIILIKFKIFLYDSLNLISIFFILKNFGISISI